MIDFAHGVFRKSAPESGECRMIGRCIVKGKSQECFERSSVVDLGFQFGIGIDLEPLLKKKAFHKEERRIGIVSLKAFTDGIVFHEQAFNPGPVDGGVEMRHSFDGPVLFHRVEKGDIGKSKVGFHVFEAHSSSKRLEFRRILAEKHTRVKTYY